jgi:hypothetical protein
MGNKKKLVETPPAPSAPPDKYQPNGILFTLPIYEGNIKPAFLQSLMALQQSLILGQLSHDFLFLTNESLIPRARNNCVARFLESPYSHMMFVDSDIEFTADDVAKLWNHAFEGHDLVCGVYKMKRPDAKFAAWKDGELIDDLDQFSEKPLIEVDYAGTGFMLISRACIDAMIEKLGETLEHDAGGFTAWDLFGTGVRDNGSGPFYISEDYDFCQKYRECGGKVMMDTSIRVGHHGNYAY